MRSHEFTKDKIGQLKEKLLYEEPPNSVIRRTKAIFNIDNPNSPSMKSHRRRNTIAFQKMKNWD